VSVDSLASKYIRELADAIVARAAKAKPNTPKFRVVWAVVSAVDAGPPPTLEIYVAGNSNLTTGVNYLLSYTPAIGDTVMCTWHGKDLVVIGALSGTSGGGLQIPITYAIVGPLTADYTYPGPFIPVPEGQSVKILHAVADISSGSANVTLKDNGTDITDLTAIDISSSPYTVTPYQWTNGHKLTIKVNSESDSGDLSFSLWVAVNG
jgi:hypothetical protein